ncbi:hypothetical protein ACIHCQ_35665 [Streptomyces sp. NPDC052236]|uniref:hypothetical protein n=1 Tax=Streptomyces sp. NPDC052236 TaxID=3365686 RepID=UPI0037D4B348
MPLFTGAYPDPLASAADATMQSALKAKRQALSLAGAPNAGNLAMTVVVLTGFEGTRQHPWAGLRENEEHYASSLVKIAAMHAAFDLRASADQLATAGGLTTWPQIEAALVAAFNPEIAAHTPALISGSPSLGAQDKTRRPDYSAVLRPGSGPDFTVDFTQAQMDAFENMMVDQKNPGATVTIHGLGYPYLNGKIADDGFFDGTSHGVWLAGDYAQQWPAARIPCVNDVDTAQGTTARHLAKLMTLLADDVLVGPLSSAGMKDLMARAGNFFPGTTPPIWPANGRFSATHGKVGMGPLKSNQLVCSEALIVHDTVRDLRFVVVWQNVIDQGLSERKLFEPVAALAEATMNAFVP